ncbi:DUF2934 domain-containing protein [Bradyrhizobium cosmicum]
MEKRSQRGIQMETPDQDRIRVRAHQLWELAGKPEGRQDDFWREAERELSGDPTINSDESSATFTE